MNRSCGYLATKTGYLATKIGYLATKTGYLATKTGVPTSSNVRLFAELPDRAFQARNNLP